MRYSLSVVIPIYNVKQFLPKAVESALAQRIDSFEVILVDDGSTDGCAEICDSYAHLKNVKVIHKKNGGLVSARKAGVTAVEGEYVTFLDGDDWAEDDYYAAMAASPAFGKADIICSAFVRDYGADKPVETVVNRAESGIYEDDACRELKQHALYGGKYFEFGIIPTVWSKLFKREMLDKWMFKIPDQITLGEDVACTMPILFDAAVIAVDNSNAGYHYRCTGSSMSRSFPADRIARIRTMLRYFSEVVSGFHAIPGLEEQFCIYASFLIKHVIKGTAQRFDTSALKEFAQDPLVRACVASSARHAGIPIRYRIMYSLMNKGSFSLTLSYYRAVAFLKDKLAE